MADSNEEILKLVNRIREALNGTDKEAIAFMEGLYTRQEIPEANHRIDVKEVLERQLKSDSAVSFSAAARECGCSPDLVARVWPAIRDQYPPSKPPSDHFVIVIPKEGRAFDLVENILAESGFRIDTASKAIVDIKNGLPPIAYKQKRQREILVSLKAGIGHAAFLGRDKTIEAQCEARENGNAPIVPDVYKQFCVNAFRMCLAVPKEPKGKPINNYADLQGKTIATSYPATLRHFLAERKITARVEYVSGGVEETVRERGMDAIMDIVESGNSLKKNNLRVLGQPVYAGDMSLIALPGTRATVLDEFAQRLQVSDSALKVA